MWRFVTIKWRWCWKIQMRIGSKIKNITIFVENRIMEMRSKYIRFVRYGVLAGLVLATFLFRWLPGLSEGYALYCYPYLSAVLSAFSALFPFSVGDCFIVLGIVWIIGNLVYVVWKRRNVKRILLRTLEFCVWIYVWFYFAWGINYFRFPFYERTEIRHARYDEGNFQAFLEDYIKGLDSSYTLAGDTLADWYLEPFHGSVFIDSLNIEEVVGEGYREIAPRFGLVQTRRNLKAKPMLWSRGMSKVGVSGYMGPFFSEFNINREELSVEYPFTYAHELAHRLGIAGEAEANLYAHWVCSRSDIPEIRFSGYFSILGYVMGNARQLLTEDEYVELYKSIRPEIISLYVVHRNYWRRKYNPQAGKVQNKVYNTYLKANRVESGTKNYSEMVGLLVSLWESEKEKREL